MNEPSTQRHAKATTRVVRPPRLQSWPCCDCVRTEHGGGEDDPQISADEDTTLRNQGSGRNDYRDGIMGDVAVTKRVIDAQSEPVILVGHSYGGAVITEAGNDPNVAGLVYIAAFVPDKDESVETLVADPPPGAPVPPILPPQEGFLFLDRAKFPSSFTADVGTEQAEFMADSQVPWGVGSLSGKDQRAGVAVQAKLVPHRDRRPDDPSARAA